MRQTEGMADFMDGHLKEVYPWNDKMTLLKYVKQAEFTDNS